MELTDEEFTTVVTMRVPMSLAKLVKSLDWKIGRKPSKAKIYLTAVQHGAEFQKLSQLQSDPEKKAKYEKELAKLMLATNKKEVLEAMDISELETLMAMTHAILNTKVDQKILNH